MKLKNKKNCFKDFLSIFSFNFDGLSIFTYIFSFKYASKILINLMQCYLLKIELYKILDINRKIICFKCFCKRKRQWNLEFAILYRFD